MVGWKKDECGQVLAFTAGIMAILLAFSFLVVDVGEAVRCRIGLQSALDAGAQMGAAVLADGLNSIALANGILLALGIGAFFSGGQTLRFVRAVQWLQDRTAALAPYQAVGTALTVARKGGAEVVFPLNGLSGGAWPSLMVKRAYFLPWIFGRKFPLWMEDALRTARASRVVSALSG